MIDIKNYVNDGASCESQAILALLRTAPASIGAGIEVRRYDKGQTQGYILCLDNKCGHKVYYCVYGELGWDGKVTVTVEKYKGKFNGTPTSEDISEADYNEICVHDRDELYSCYQWILCDMKNEVNGVKRLTEKVRKLYDCFIEVNRNIPSEAQCTVRFKGEEELMDVTIAMAPYDVDGGDDDEIFFHCTSGIWDLLELISDDNGEDFDVIDVLYFN